MKFELRNVTEIRATDNDKMVVSGYVNETGKFSEVMGNRSKRFREKVERGAFTRALNNRERSIDFLAEHDEKLILASTKNGSLVLREDSKGLFMEAEIANTSWGKDYYQLISEGLISNMSFGFRVVRDEWNNGLDGISERTIHDLELFEVSAVKNPAYRDSNIAARSLEIIEEPFDQKKLDEEQEQKVKGIKLDMQIRKSKQAIKNFEKLKGMGVNIGNNLENEKRKLSNLEKEQKEMETKEKENRSTLNKVEQGINSQKQTEMVEHVSEKSNVFEMAEKIPFDTTEIKVPIDQQGLPEIKFLEEGQDADNTIFTMKDSVKLKQKRVAHSIAVSKQLLLDSGTNLVDHFKNKAMKIVQQSLEKAVFHGEGDKDFLGIVTDHNVEKIEGTFNVELFKKLRKNIPTAHKDGSVFFISSEDLEEIEDIQLPDGSYLLKDDSTILGFEVQVTDNLEKGNVVFGNVAEAYMVAQNTPLHVRIANDDTFNTLAGRVVILAEFIGDGRVTNHQAIAVGQVAPTI